MNPLASIYSLVPLFLLLALVFYVFRGRGGGPPWFFFGGGDSSGPPSGGGDDGGD